MKILGIISLARFDLFTFRVIVKKVNVRFGFLFCFSGRPPRLVNNNGDHRWETPRQLRRRRRRRRSRRRCFGRCVRRPAPCFHPPSGRCRRGHDRRPQVGGDPGGPPGWPPGWPSGGFPRGLRGGNPRGPRMAHRDPHRCASKANLLRGDFYWFD